MSIFGAYFVFCACVGYAGMKKVCGFWGAFFIAVFTTPLLGILIVQLIPEPKPNLQKLTYKCHHCRKRHERRFKHCPSCRLDAEGYTGFELAPGVHQHSNSG